MTQGAQGVHHSSGATSVWSNSLNNRNNIPHNTVKKQYNSIMDIANDPDKLKAAIQAGCTGGGTIW